jgi:hypothetical protein
VERAIINHVQARAARGGWHLLDVLQKMDTTINNPKLANLALVVVIIVSVVVASVGAVFLEGMEWLGFLFIAASILGLAYFLPETTTRRFSNRQSAVGGSCLFLYLAISSGISGYSAR